MPVPGLHTSHAAHHLVGDGVGLGAVDDNCAAGLLCCDIIIKRGLRVDGNGAAVDVKVAMSMLCNEKDCEDAMQTAILSAFEKLSTLKHEEYFRTWLMRILINTCNKQLR